MIYRRQLPGYLRQGSYLANAAGHFTVDMMSSTVPLLLALFSLSLGLSNTAIGSIVTLQTLISSTLQPIFGWLADRYGTRWFGFGGLLWMALFYALSALSPGWWAVLCLVLLGIGSAAYHPQGALIAGKAPVQQAATATAIFFLFGQIGLGLGPAVAGSLIENWGRPALVLLSALTLLVALALWRHPTAHTPPGAVPDQAANAAQQGFGTVVMVLFAFLLFSRMTVQNTTSTFLPKYLQEEGWSPAAFGVAASMLMIGSAIGNVMGGHLADRWGRRKVLAGSLFLAAVPLAFYLHTAAPWLHLLVFSIGVLAGTGFSVTVVMAQSLLPGRQALASGLTLGFMFASGAIGATVAGWFGDQMGLDVVLPAMAGVAVLSGLSALALPSTVRREEQESGLI